MLLLLDIFITKFLYSLPPGIVGINDDDNKAMTISYRLDYIIQNLQHSYVGDTTYHYSHFTGEKMEA